MKLKFDIANYKLLPTGVSSRQDMYPYVNDIQEKRDYPSVLRTDGTGAYADMPFGRVPVAPGMFEPTFDVLAFEVLAPPENNKHSYDFFDIGAGDIVIDGGAYEGLFSAMCVHKGATVIAVEPLLHMYNYLSTPNKINKALASTDGVIDFYLMGESSRIGGISNIDSGVSRIAMPTVTIDSILKYYSPMDVLLKLDIEGAEYDALLGAKETITKYRPKLIIETYHDYFLKEFTASKIVEYLRSIHPDYNILLWGFHNNLWGFHCTNSPHDYIISSIIVW